MVEVGAMRSRERFNASVDEEEELFFSWRVKEVRKILKQLSNDLHLTCAVIEPCEYMLSWGSLRRCLICIESAVTLVSQGYVGSANALLRQMYEFLLWSKLGLDADAETIKKINSYFYDESLERTYLATDILKYTKIPGFGDVEAATIRDEGKRVFKNYSTLTHATGIAQQNPYKQEDFYWYINACLCEICTMLDLLLIIFEQYCQKVMECFDALDVDLVDICSGKYDPQKDNLFSASFNAGRITYRISGYREALASKQNVEEIVLTKAFMQKWAIQGEKLKPIK